MTAVIVRPLNTTYTQSIGAYWKKLPKIVRNAITMQFDYGLSHGNF